MTKRISRFLTCCALSLSLVQVPVHAQATGQIISYQGLLTGAGGLPVPDGPQNLTFRIFENNAAVFSQNSPVVSVGGVFNAFLSVGALSFDPAKTYELGITFGGEETRHPIAAVPVALNAKNAVSAANAVSATNFTGLLAGDVAGAQNSTVVQRLRGTPLSPTAPAIGQVLSFDGTSYKPTTPAAATVQSDGTTITGNGSAATPLGVRVPLPLSGSSASAILSATNTGSGSAGSFAANSAGNTSPAVSVSTTGIGSGVSVQLTNAANGARGIDVTQSGVGPGVFSTSAGGMGLWGITSSISAAGVIGDNNTGEAVVGRNRGGNGVGAVVGRNDDAGYGVRGFNTKDGIGVLGQAGISGGTGVAGRFENVNAANSSDAFQAATNGSGLAGRFTGSVRITGNLTVDGTVAKGGGSFKIDHPLDPANKYLSHSFVESPDMMNIYNGNVRLDAAGEAVVTMPNYFLALNRDFRYQLTSIGAPGPNLYVAQTISGNKFKIAGGKPGSEVSWQVTGIRQDAWANAHRIPTEEAKVGTERGQYLFPQLFGQKAELGITRGRAPETRQQKAQGTKPLASDTPSS